MSAGHSRAGEEMLHSWATWRELDARGRESRAERESARETRVRGGQQGHVAQRGWRTSVHGTHAERRENPGDARMRRTRARELRCAPSARLRGNSWAPRLRCGSGRHVAVPGSRLLGLARGLSARLVASDGLMGFGPNWAFLGLNFWVLLGKLAQIQLFSSKT